jgi:hypothetical protein
MYFMFGLTLDPFISRPFVCKWQDVLICPGRVDQLSVASLLSPFVDTNLTYNRKRSPQEDARYPVSSKQDHILHIYSSFENS